MPGLRSTTDWTTRAGSRRRVRLYGAWKNLHGRIRGIKRAGNGSQPWLGKQCLWPTWASFRAWSLANGYCAARNSLDRFFDFEDYGPDTCRWISVADNTRAMTRGVCAAHRDDADDVPF